MPVTLNIPNGTGTHLPVSIAPGEILFVLGANGVGKSSLLHQIYAGNPEAYQRISAHRQTWFSSNHVSLTARDREQSDQNFRNQDRSRGRWSEWSAEARINVAIFDIVAAENRAAQDIANAARAGDNAAVAALAAKSGPIEILNRLFRLSNLPVAVELEGDSLFAKRGGVPYGVEKLSDGERTALLLAAVVLTAPAGKVFLIDEPERHLHRSIISPFLRLLLAQRPDCAFLVSTHEVMLPVETPQSRTILLRGCTYTGEDVTAFDCALVDSAAGVPDDLKADILGARSTVLFVEGEAASLDRPLYSIVFPGVSIIAKGGCRDVEQAVAGLSGANALRV
jgi:ABC-type ATPase involved in cell division